MNSNKTFEDNYVANYLDAETALYVRGTTDNKDALIKALNDKIGAVRVLTREDAPENEIAFVTNPAPEGTLRNGIESADGLNVESIIRVADL